jgi:hypothetical protein
MGSYPRNHAARKSIFKNNTQNVVNIRAQIALNVIIMTFESSWKLTIER